MSGGRSAAFGPLVSTAWLAERLADPRSDVRVVDCRWYLKPFDMRDPRRRVRPGPHSRRGAPALGHALGRCRPPDPGDVGAARGLRRGHGRRRYRRAHHGRGLRRRPRHRGGPAVVGAAGVRPPLRGGSRRGHRPLGCRGPPAEHRSAALATGRFRRQAALGHLRHAPRRCRRARRPLSGPRGLPHGTRPGRGRRHDPRQRLPARHRVPRTTRA